MRYRSPNKVHFLNTHWRQCRINIEIDANELDHWAAQLADDYLPDQWERIDSTPFSRIAVNRSRQLYYKEFLPHSPLASLVAIARGSRGTRARLNSETLLLLGIDAPINIRWGKLPRGREYLFTALPAGQDLPSWLLETNGVTDPEKLSLRWQMLRELGTFIGRLHGSGFLLGDLHPHNVFATLNHGRFRFTLIDNEGNTHRNPPPGKMLLRNLIQLNLLSQSAVSRTDRLRFFLAWRRQVRDVSPIEGKVLAAEAYRLAIGDLPNAL